MTLEELYRLLRTGHVQAQGIVDTLREPLVVLDKDYCVLNANTAFYRTFSTDRESTYGRTLFDLGDGQWDIPELRLLLKDVVPKAAAVVGYQVTHTFPEIGLRTIHVSARQLAHPDENSTQMLVVFEDVTAQQKSDAAKDILVAETQHRMRTLLAMVQSVARQTKATGRTGEEYRDVFLGRFTAIVKAQEFISANGLIVGLADLIDLALSSIAGPRTVISPGPAVNLAASQISPVSMMLHELATNAVKYGALSNSDGIVHLTWITEQIADQRRLVFEWREEGGPAVSSPTYKGFGTELLDYSSKAEGGEAVFDFLPSGLRVQVSIALEN